MIQRLKTLSAEAEALAKKLDALEGDLPEGRTRDVAEQASLAAWRAYDMLSTEAATLERLAAEL